MSGQPQASSADRQVPRDCAPAALAYASGLTGFFDPAERKLYLYASDLTTPFMTAEIDELGKPLKVTQLAK